MYTWGPSHFLFQQYLKNVILCKDRSIGIQKKKNLLRGDNCFKPIGHSVLLPWIQTKLS